MYIYTYYVLYIYLLEHLIRLQRVRSAFSAEFLAPCALALARSGNVFGKVLGRVFAEVFAEVRNRNIKRKYLSYDCIFQYSYILYILIYIYICIYVYIYLYVNVHKYTKLCKLYKLQIMPYRSA